MFIVPPSPVKHEPVEFAAPVGRHVRLVTGFCLIVIGGLALVPLAILISRGEPAHQAWLTMLAPVCTATVIVPIMLYSQVLGYRLTRDELIVLRRRRQNRYALNDLQGVAVDPKAMAWSIKVFGNDGLGAITGRFRNRKLGAYQAFVTDRIRGVVLRWPDRCLVVSPDRPEEFAAQIRARAGLKD